MVYQRGSSLCAGKISTHSSGGGIQCHGDFTWICADGGQGGSVVMGVGHAEAGVRRRCGEPTMSGGHVHRAGRGQTEDLRSGAGGAELEIEDARHLWAAKSNSPSQGAITISGGPFFDEARRVCGDEKKLREQFSGTARAACYSQVAAERTSAVARVAGRVAYRRPRVPAQ